MKSLIPEFVRQLRCMTLLFVMALTVGCSTDEHTAQLIARAERIAKEYPDSAYTIIRSVDSETIYGDRDMAHYRLVYSEALYYSKIDSDNDSLTLPMAEYYRYDDNHAERARAMYQHALVKYYGGEHAESMYYLFEAEKSLEHISNPRLAGLVHRAKGDIYGAECLFGHAIEEMKIAVEYFEQANLPEFAGFSIYRIGNLELQNQNFDSAKEYLSTAKEYAQQSNKNYLYNNVLLDFAHLYIIQSQYEECAKLLQQIDYVSKEGKRFYYCFYAIVTAYMGDYELAELYVEECKKYDDEKGSMKLYAQVMIAKFREDYETAFRKACEIMAVEDKLLVNLLSSPMLDLQVQFIESDLEQTIKDNRFNHFIIVAVSVIVLFIIIIVALVLYYRNKQYRKDIDSYISIISEFELTSGNSIDSSLQSVINELYRDRMDEINKLCEVYYAYNNSSSIAVKVFEQVKTILEGMKSDSVRLAKLEAMVNCSIDNAMIKLRELCPNLTDREYRIVLYSFAGFSNRAICILEECNVDTLPKIKYKIRERIKRAQSPDIEPLLQCLSKKKLHVKND